jgi:hypothetical protein
MTSTDRSELAKIPAIPKAAQEDRAYLRLWFTLARLPWQSLVLVPSCPGGSADEAARKLAEVGEKVSGLPVRSVTIGQLDYGTANALADLQERLRRLVIELGRPRAAIEVAGTDVDASPADRAPGRGPGSGGESRSGEEAPWEQDPGEPVQVAAGVRSSVAKFIIAVPDLVGEPLGLSATQAADGVIVVVELGRTKMADVRQIIELVGRQRVLGSILVK